MHWIGIWLPALSLETFEALRPRSTGPVNLPTDPASASQAPAAGSSMPAAPAVVLLAQHRVVCANAAARESGVTPGMKRATALALRPDLVIGTADTERDARALLAVAHAVMNYTPAVSLVPPLGLVADVQASLRCFGGADSLWQRLHDTLAGTGHRAQCAAAPTPLGALWLARTTPPGAPAVQAPRVIDPQALQRRLRALPVALLLDSAAGERGAPVPRGVVDVLQASGLTELGPLRDQPRAALSRRIGPELLTLLDRAWGDSPDPREPLQPPAEHDDLVDLWARTDQIDALLDGADVLLARLLRWAQVRQGRVSAFRLTFHHETRLHGDDDTPRRTALDIGLAEPTADPLHLRSVLKERLARQVLPAPVLAIGLYCGQLVQAPPPNRELFPSAAGQREGLLRLIERLQARLGPEQVQCLAPLSEHRPEHGTTRHDALQSLPATLRRATSRAAGQRGGSGDAAAHRRARADGGRLTRPVWLLPAPEPLPERQSRPWLAGQPLRLIAGPERIETGWWDGAAAARDYFIAQTPDGLLVWIYRLRLAPAPGEPGWFLQGRFG